MDREYLDRIDRHMERGNEIMDRSNEIMDRSNEIMDRSHEIMGRVEQELQLTRELHAAYMQEMREVRRGYRLTISQLFDLARESRDAMREMREASETHTRAIWALLDRLDNGGASAATG